MTFIWNDILQQVNIVNKAIQPPGIEICTIVELYNGLLTRFQNMRSADEFDLYVKKAKQTISGLSDCSEITSRRRKH